MSRIHIDVRGVRYPDYQAEFLLNIAYNFADDTINCNAAKKHFREVMNIEDTDLKEITS